jgi:hypothetical protein
MSLFSAIYGCALCFVYSLLLCHFFVYVWLVMSASFIFPMLWHSFPSVFCLSSVIEDTYIVIFMPLIVHASFPLCSCTVFPLCVFGSCFSITLPYSRILCSYIQSPIILLLIHSIKKYRESILLFLFCFEYFYHRILIYFTLLPFITVIIEH